MVVRLIHRLFRTPKDYFPIAPQIVAVPQRAARKRPPPGMRRGGPGRGPDRPSGTFHSDATARVAPARRGASAAPAPQLKESPQAQEPDAFGLSIVKPCFSIESTKSMVAPVR